MQDLMIKPLERLSDETLGLAPLDIAVVNAWKTHIQVPPPTGAILKFGTIEIVTMA